MFLIILVLFLSLVNCSHHELSWNGGPAHLNCDHIDIFKQAGHHVKENVIAVKAIVFKDDIYVLTPRMKPGVLATIWRVERGRSGVELQPYPDLHAHALSECNALQNAVDFYLDHLGNLWILDTGVIDTQQNPRCTCPPKVLVISLLLGKVTQQIELQDLVEPTALPQNIAVDYEIGGQAFVYITEAASGGVVVYETSHGGGWTVRTCAPARGLQLALTRRCARSVLTLVRVPHSGLLQLDTAALRRRDTILPLTVFGEHSSPILLLGSSSHHVFLRTKGSSDVLVWDTREPYNESLLENIHSPPPHLVPTSVSTDPILHTTIVLDSNYAETIQANTPTYHRITYIDKLFL